MSPPVGRGAARRRGVRTPRRPPRRRLVGSLAHRRRRSVDAMNAAISASPAPERVDDLRRAAPAARSGRPRCGRHCLHRRASRRRSARRARRPSRPPRARRPRRTPPRGAAPGSRRARLSQSSQKSHESAHAGRAQPGRERERVGLARHVHPAIGGEPSRDVRRRRGSRLRRRTPRARTGARRRSSSTSVTPLRPGRTSMPSTPTPRRAGLVDDRAPLVVVADRAVVVGARSRTATFRALPPGRSYCVVADVAVDAVVADARRTSALTATSPRPRPARGGPSGRARRGRRCRAAAPSRRRTTAAAP